jgi:cytochrome c-type biogenesis protein CcmH/NrfG
VLIYTDHLSLVFVRRDSGNSSVIQKYSIDKERGMNTIIAQASGWAMTDHEVNPNYYMTLGKIFFKMGKLDDAEKAFTAASERAPNNSVIKGWLQKVKKNKN